MGRPTWLRLSPEALRNNLAAVRYFAPEARVMAVVKAEAYGHGLSWAGRVLEAAGVDALGVACTEEGRRLREAGVRIPVFVLEGFFREEDLWEAEELELGLVLHRRDQVAAVLGRGPQRPVLPCFLKVDTGMHRLGVDLGNAAELAPALAGDGRVQWCGLLSHLARGDDPEDPYNEHQLALLRRLADDLDDDPPLSLANSAGIMALPGTRLDWVRPGLMLYGVSPFPGRTGAELGLQPVLALESEVVAVRELAAGDWLGYGTGYRAEHPLRVGVVPLGYGDGYTRALATGTPVRVAGEPSRILGRVCMDMLFVDLDGLTGAGEGSVVELVGPGVPAETLAHAAETIPYEILCGLRDRVRPVPG